MIAPAGESNPRQHLVNPQQLVVAVGLAALPGSPDAVTAPATLIWRFRVASLAGAAAFWSVTGVVLGWLLDTGRRAHERHDHERDDRTGVTVGG